MAAGGMSGHPSFFAQGRKKSLYNETVRRDKCYEHNLTCIKFSILHFFNKKPIQNERWFSPLIIEISKHECCMRCSHDSLSCLTEIAISCSNIVSNNP